MSSLRERYQRPDVVFTGFLEGEELATAYASADAFVFPSTTDTFGNVVLEAHASGLPVIVSNRGGPAETVTEGESGLIFDALEPAALKAAMRRVLDNRELREQLAAGALENAQHSGWQEVLDDLWAPKNNINNVPEVYHHIRGGLTTGVVSLEVA